MFAGTPGASASGEPPAYPALPGVAATLWSVLCQENSVSGAY